MSDFIILPFYCLEWVASPSVTSNKLYSLTRFSKKFASHFGGHSGSHLSLWAFQSPPKRILSHFIISPHLAVCAGLPWLVTLSTWFSRSYTFTNLISLPDGYLTSNTWISPSPPLSNSETSRCLSLLIAVIVLPPLTSLYPGWLILYPSFSTTSSCIMGVSGIPALELGSVVCLCQNNLDFWLLWRLFIIWNFLSRFFRRWHPILSLLQCLRLIRRHISVFLLSLLPGSPFFSCFLYRLLFLNATIGLRNLIPLTVDALIDDMVAVLSCVRLTTHHIASMVLCQMLSHTQHACRHLPGSAFCLDMSTAAAYSGKTIWSGSHEHLHIILHSCRPQSSFEHCFGHFTSFDCKHNQRCFLPLRLLLLHMLWFSNPVDSKGQHHPLILSLQFLSQFLQTSSRLLPKISGEIDTMPSQFLPELILSISTFPASIFLATLITISVYLISISAVAPWVVIVDRHTRVFFIIPWMRTKCGIFSSKSALFTADEISKSFFSECGSPLSLLNVTLLFSIEFCPGGTGFNSSFLCWFCLFTSVKPSPFFLFSPCGCWARSGCIFGCAGGAALCAHISFFFASCLFSGIISAGFWTSGFFPSPLGPFGVSLSSGCFTHCFFFYCGTAGTTGFFFRIVTCLSSRRGNSFFTPPGDITGACSDCYSV